MVPLEMLSYALYAERFGWTPQQVDQLTLEQEDWLMPIVNAFDDERERQRRKAEQEADRKRRAEQARGK